MKPNRAIISLGSNIEAEKNIYKAIEELKNHFNVISVSSIKTTKPIGITNQPDFLNGVVLVLTVYNQEKVTILLKEIENKMGRDRSLPKFGPRIIDLDILFWNNRVVDDDYYNREFLQMAVAEITSTKIVT